MGGLSCFFRWLLALPLSQLVCRQDALVDTRRRDVCICIRRE